MNKKIINLEATEEDEGLRLDKYLAQSLENNRSRVKKIISDENVTLNGKLVKASYKVRNGDVFTVLLPIISESPLKPYNFKLDIIYEDQDLIVVNKGAGMVVHPGQGDVHAEDSLVNALLWHCDDLQSINDVVRPGIVHRIDKDTSGLLVVAKNEKSLTELARQFSERLVKKRYIALVCGKVEPMTATIDSPIGRDAKDRKKMAIVDEKKGRNAVTKYFVREYFMGFTLLDVVIETGRTHQIRVHMAAIGHPIVGDDVYGKKKVNKENAQSTGLERQFLHASEIEFTHPVSKKQLKFQAELPDDLKRALELI